MNRRKITSRFRIRTILIVVNLIVLLLPLGSIYFLKIYEDELVRQTENELVSQGAAIVSAYSQEVEEILSSLPKENLAGRNYGIEVKIHPEGYYQRIPEKLEFSKDKINPPFPEAEPPTSSLDAIALEAGKKVTPILKKTKAITLAGIRLTDYNGVVTATSGIEYGLSLKHSFEIKQALKGQPISNLRLRVTDTKAYSWASTSRDTGLRVFVALPIISNHRIIGTILLSRTPRSIKKALYDKKERVFGAVIILLTTIVLLAFFTSFTISKPINALIQQTERIASGEAIHPTKIENPITREFELLSKAFAEMAERIEVRSDYIRKFALNISHEFKTPLTSIQGSLELLQNYVDTMSREKRDRFYNNMLKDTNRLKKLMNRLLEMARADVFQPGDETADILDLLEHLKDSYAERGLRVQLESPDNRVISQVAPDVFETIITNLMENSLQHHASTILIQINAENGIELNITDNGGGISEANAKQIFTPFFTTMREEGGTGLGLPIVKTLLQAYGGKISLLPSTSGAHFTITLPAKKPHPKTSN